MSSSSPSSSSSSPSHREFDESYDIFEKITVQHAIHLKEIQKQIFSTDEKKEFDSKAKREVLLDLFDQFYTSLDEILSSLENPQTLAHSFVENAMWQSFEE